MPQFNNRLQEYPCHFSTFRAVVLVLLYFPGYYYGTGYLAEFIAVYLFRINQLTYPVLVITYLLELLLFVIVGWPIIKESYINLKGKLATINFFKITGAHFVALYLSIIAVGLVVSLFTSGDSSNQESLNQMGQQAPAFLIFSACIFAPIVEELIFRGVIYRKLSQHGHVIFALIASSLCFAIIHIYGALVEQQWSELIFILSYGTIGLFLGSVYEKTASIFSAMLLHCAWNSLAVILMFIR